MSKRFLSFVFILMVTATAFADDAPPIIVNWDHLQISPTATAAPSSTQSGFPGGVSTAKPSNAGATAAQCSNRSYDVSMRPVSSFNAQVAAMKGTWVCLDRIDICGHSWGQKLVQNVIGGRGWRAPDRWAQVEWQLSGGAFGVLGNGKTDANGYYLDSDGNPGLCAKIVPSVKAVATNVETRVRHKAAGPSGSELWTDWVKVMIPLGGGRVPANMQIPQNVIRLPGVLVVGAPAIDEMVFTNDHAENLGSTVPMIASHDLVGDPYARNNFSNGRIFVNVATQQLIYDGAKSPKSGAEFGGAFNFKLGDQGVVPNFTDGGGVVVVKDLEINYDYETNLQVPEDPNSSSLVGAGPFDGVGGFYSHFRIYVALAEPIAEACQENPQVCTGDPIDSVSADPNRPDPRQGNPLELLFKNVVEQSGGISGGRLPGVFWSNSGKNTEHFNTVMGTDYNGVGRGSLACVNCPLLDLDQFAEQRVAILVIESDEDRWNDTVAFFPNVDLEPLSGNPAAVINLDNSQFLAQATLLDGTSAREVVISRPNLNYTLRMTLGYANNVQIWQGPAQAPDH